MAYRATQVAPEPLMYFYQENESPLRVGDVVLRANQDPKEIFSRLIRMATNSHWSHCALLYMLHDSNLGFDKTFLVEAMTQGARVTSWNKEVEPPEHFTVGIKRLQMDWYTESPEKQAHHVERQREDTHGIAYLHHVRGMALDQIESLYDHKVVDELTALYLERVFKRRLGAIPILAQAAGYFAERFRKKDDALAKQEHLMRFICSGLVQYSFFEALRCDISNDLSIPENRDAGIQNLQNLHQVIFCPDPNGVIDDYIRRVKMGQWDIGESAPDTVLDLLKTTTPADFNDSSKVVWRYIIRKGVVWKIDTMVDDSEPQSQNERDVLALMEPEHQKE